MAKRKIILIVTTSQDVGASYIIEKLRLKKNCLVYRFNTEDFPSRVGVLIYQNSNGKTETVFDFPFQGKLKASEIDSVLYRREGEPVLDKSIRGKDNLMFARTEVIGALDSIWDTLNCFWVNHPRYSTALMTKVAQTKYAGEVGLRVPKTVVSTKKEELLGFYESCGGNVIVKQLGNARGAQDWINGRLYTRKLERNDLKFLDSVSLSPVMFQEAITKSVELRITVVGNKIFPVEIHSQLDKNTSVDWRRGPVNKIPHSPYVISKGLERKLIRLHERLGLIYSGTDLIITPEGEEVLLELNPNGEYVWTEILTGMPITEALCELLIKGEKHGERGTNPAIRNAV